MKTQRIVVYFLAALTLLRLAAIGFFELSPDEAYYHMWSERMDICFYSKGPGVAAVIWLGTHLFGATVFGIRFFSPLLACGTSWLLFRFTRRLYGDSVALWTVIALNAVPIYNVGGVLMTIDPLSMFFWMAALYTFWLALEEGLMKWWVLTGASIGLGMLCKYTNAMELLSILLLLVFTKRYREQLRRRGFWVMLALAVVCLAPPIIWNARHAWITLHHLTVRGGLEKAFRISFSELFEFIGAHFGVYSPLIFAGMVIAFWQGVRLSRMHFKPRFLMAFALPLFAMYLWLSLKEAGEANWTAPATLSLGIFAVAYWHEKAQEHRWARIFCVAAICVGAGLSAVTLATDFIRLVGYPLSYANDPSTRLRGWETTAETVEAFRTKFEKESGAPVFLIANKYQTSAELAFYLKDKRPAGPGHPPVYIPESQDIENQFSFWRRYDESLELSDIAREYLNDVSTETDPVITEGVAAALKALEDSEKSHSSKLADAKRSLAHALQVAWPELPLDQAYVEEEGPNPFSGKTALYITDRPEEKPPSSIKGGFEKCEMVKCFDIDRRGQPLRQIRIFACYNYRGMPL